MKKIILLVIFFVSVIVIGIFIGLSQIKNMPTNSLKTIRNTITNHKVEEFYKLVDVDNVLNQAAEVILADKLNQDTTAYSMQKVNDAYNQIKPDFINVTKQAVNDYVQGGSVKLPNPVQTETQRWLKHSDINYCVIESMTKPIVTNDSAVANVQFRNTKLNFSFEFEVELKRLDDKSWRLISVKGFEDYNKSLKHALDRKLDQLNAPIRDQMYEIFQIKGIDARIGEGDEYGFSQTLRMSLKADVKSSKPLSKIIGKIIVEDGQERENSAAFTIDMAYHPQGLQTFNIDKVLNPFVRGDVNIMKHGMRKNQLNAQIDEIIFLDGTNLKAFDKLPD